MQKLLFLLFGCLITVLPATVQGQTPVPLWTKFESGFESSKSYGNPLYDVRLEVTFQSPTGRSKTVFGFWDGGSSWRVRFAADEIGEWSFRTECSDTANTGLHGQTGHLMVTPQQSPHPLYLKGTLVRPPGRYHLTHADGSPFLWFADTAWNGALKSSDTEWRLFLKDRANLGFNAIQLVSTQWRGADGDATGEAAFTGSGKIQLNPAFFQRLDRKIDMVNDEGLIAAVVLLWALPVSLGKELSPGYFLPEPEAILLARYMVARYGGNQVVWFLGGDGKYIEEYEQRWKTIGQAVFAGGKHQGLVAQHPQGRSWIGDVYAGEAWLDIVGYQSSHGTGEQTVNWINRGPMAERWDKLPARPLINLEPLYENGAGSNSDDVRKACYWSLFATPVAGITYGNHATWPWLKRGEKALNHSGAPSPNSWQDSLAFNGVKQVSNMVRMMREQKWWDLRPRHRELLAEQPGLTDFSQFIPLLGNDDGSTILAYVPAKLPFRIRNPRLLEYRAQWFDPVENKYSDESSVPRGPLLDFAVPFDHDGVLILKTTP